MKNSIKDVLVAAGAAMALAGATAPAWAQPGYMHQRLIGLPGVELLRDVRPTPLDALSPDDYGSAATGDLRLSTTALSDVLLLRKDPTGTVLWSEIIPAPNTDEHGYKVAVGSAVGEVACVYTGTAIPTLQTGLLQVDSAGGLISSFWLRGTGQAELVNNRDVGVSIRIVKSEDRLITANHVVTVTDNQTGVLIRTMPIGIPLWTWRYENATTHSRVSFSDVTELPPLPGLGQHFLVVGTIADLAGPRSILALRVDGAGAVLAAWQLSVPAGAGLNLYGDGVDTTNAGDAIVSGRVVFDPGSPLGVADVLIRFDPVAGAVLWSLSHRQFIPGRAAVQWREGCAKGAAVAGLFRSLNAAGAVIEQPMVLLTNDAGGTINQLTHTDSFDARFDGLSHFEGTYGARVVADGWGTFAPLGYGSLDALTVRTDQIAMAVHCPMDLPADTVDLPILVSQREIRRIQDLEYTQANGPEFITLRDDQWCKASPCDTIDFNNDGIFPDAADLLDYLGVFGGGACSTGCCNDIDFNNDGIFPDVVDLNTFLFVFGGGAC